MDQQETVDKSGGLPSEKKRGNDRHVKRCSPVNIDGRRKPRWLRMTSPSPNGMKIAMARSIAVVRRSPLQRKHRTTRPEKMSRIPLTHIKGKAAGSWIGMPKAVEAPTGLSMKLIPIPMMPTGITRVHQKSSEFLLRVELSKLVVVFICFLFLPLACHGQPERLLARHFHFDGRP